MTPQQADNIKHLARLYAESSSKVMLHVLVGVSPEEKLETMAENVKARDILYAAIDEATTH